MLDFSQFVVLVSCTLIPMFWFFFLYEEDCGTLKDSDIPGDPGLYFVGEALACFQDPLDFAFRRFAKYGNIFRTKLMGHGVVFVKGPLALELFSGETAKGLGACPEAYIYDLPALVMSTNSHRRSVMMSESNYQHGFKHLAVLASITALCNKQDFVTGCVDIITKHMSFASNKPVSGAKLCKDIFLQISISLLMKNTTRKNSLKELLERWFQMQASYPVSPLGVNRRWETGKRATRELDELIMQEVQDRLHVNRDFGDDLIGCMLETAMRRSDGFGKTLQDLIEKTVLGECWTLLYKFSVQLAGACCWLLVAFERYQHIKEAAITEVRNCPDRLNFSIIRGT